MFYCWDSVADDGPTLNRHWAKKVNLQVYSLISSLKTYHPPTLHFTPLVTGPAHSCVISTPLRAYSPAAISAH